ncbi:protein kinase [Candidatus Obscuribacterales bacterium]|nr:protein kinase [Candidatus Obscuribacterales bacterium]
MIPHAGATGWILNLGSCRCEDAMASHSSQDANSEICQTDGNQDAATANGASDVKREPGDSVEIEVPKCIDDRFDVLEVLGKGGMGTVYKVRDREVGSIFALKLLHQNLQSDPAILKRFEQEAKAAEQLDHPNLVPTYSHGVTSGGEPYLLIEYVEGETLAKIIEREGALDADRAIALFEQICSALSYAHDKKIIHRDIKPANIIISKTPGGDDVIRVVDFGIAKTITEVDRSTRNLTQTGEVFGSPHYMSPEQCLGLMLDEKSDIYSLGCVMFEAMSGKPPFAGSNPIQLVVKHINDKPKPYLPKFSTSKKEQSLQSIALKCLEKEGVDRFQDVGEIEHALERIKSGRAVNFDQNSKFKTSIFQKQLHVTAFVLPWSLILLYSAVFILSSIQPPTREHSGVDPLIALLIPLLIFSALPVLLTVVFSSYVRTCLRVARENFATKRHWWTTFSLTLSAAMCIGAIPTFFYWGYYAYWNEHSQIWNPLSNFDLFIFPGFLLSFISAIGVIVSSIGFGLDGGPKKISLKRMLHRATKPMVIACACAGLVVGCFFSDVVRKLSDIYTSMPASLCSDMRTKVVYFARQISPENVDMIFNSSVVSQQTKNYPQAVLDLSDLMRLNTDKSSREFDYRLTDRAQIYTIALQWDKAIADWTKLTKIDPDSCYNYRMLGNCQFAQGKYHLALQSYDESLKRNFTDVMSYYKKANAQNQLKDYDGALQTMEQRSKLYNGLRPAMYLIRGYTHSLQGNDSGAVSDYKLAAAAKPRDDSYWDEVARASAYLELGDETAALNSIKEAKKLHLSFDEFMTSETALPVELRKKIVQFVLKNNVFPAERFDEVRFGRIAR